MGSYVDGIYVPVVGEVGWGEEVGDDLRQLSELGINPTSPPYGAVADGVADDTAPLQDWLDANGSQGGVLAIPGAIYGISDTLLIGHHGGAQSNSLKLTGAAGALGTKYQNSNKAVWLKALPTFPSDGRPMMLVQNIHGTTLEGINFTGARAADVLLKVTHSIGDQNPHNILFESCMFRGALTYSTVIGSTTSADEADADTANLRFSRCVWQHSAVDGPNTRAYVRGTSQNSLPVSFYGCEWGGERASAVAGVDYHMELTGGMYNIFGGLMGGADVSSLLYNVNPIMGVDQVPPCVNVYGLESQGDNAFIRWDYSTSRSTSAGQRGTSLTGVYVGSDGSPFDVDAIQWDAAGFDPLTLTSVRLNANLNIVSPTTHVYVNGLSFPEADAGTIIGHKEVVSGFWYDGNQVGSVFAGTKPRAQTQGTFVLGHVASRPPADAAELGAVWYDTTLRKPVFSDGTVWRDATGLLAFTPADLSGPGLSGWYDLADPAASFVDDGVTATAVDGDAIYRVNDKSGNDNHLMQPTAGKRPLHKLAILNGLAVARFDGANDFLQSVLLNASMPFTVFMVLRYLGAASSARATFMAAPGSINTLSKSATNDYWGFFPSNTTTERTSTTPVNASWHVVQGRWNASTGALFVDGGAAVVSGAMDGAVNLQGLTLGSADDGASQFAQIDLGEVVVLGSPSVATQNQVGHYLADRWTLTWGTVT